MKQLIIITFLFAIFSSCSDGNSTEQETITGNPDSIGGKRTYLNPVDNKAYVTEGEFETYTPDDGVKKLDGSVQPINIILLTDQNELEKVISVQDLSDFIGGVEDILINDFSSVKDSGQILFQFTLYSDKRAKTDLSYNGDFKNKDLNNVFQKIEQYGNDIRTQRDSCVFQCNYAVNEEQK